MRRVSIKELTAIYGQLLSELKKCLQERTTIPKTSLRIQYFLPKKGDDKDPSKYRPIACSSSIYKTFAVCIYSGENTETLQKLTIIIAEEQEGVKNNIYGCK